MNYADIKQYDVANGPGVRVSLFVSGCTRRCPGCFNQEAWDFSYGSPFTEETFQTLLGYLSPSYVRGLSVLGGEPFEHTNQQGLLPFLELYKKTYPQKDLWCFSGYDFQEDILGRMVHQWPETLPMLGLIDVLVDGRFVEAQKSPDLYFKGSANQRTILVQPTLAENRIVLWEPTKRN